MAKLTIEGTNLDKLCEALVELDMVPLTEAARSLIAMVERAVDNGRWEQ